MKIVFCIKKLSGVSGGAEWVLASVANGLARRSHKVYVISFDNKGEKSFYEFSDSVELINLGGCEFSFISTFKQFWRMKNAAVSLNPDVVFGFLPSTFVALSILFWFSKFKFVACEHIARDWYNGHWLKYLLVSLAGNISCGISFLSDEIAESFGLVATKRKLILHDPVRKMSKTANVMAPSKTHFTILNVGRLVEFKDQRTLIECFSRIQHDFPQWRLKIIGRGQLRCKLDSQIRRLMLENVVEILDYSDDIEEEYANADLFVVSSLYEGFGLVTAEASSAGLPCVGFADCEGTNKIIENGVNGILVKHEGDRVGSLEINLRELLTDSKRMRGLGKNGLIRPKRYELENVLEKWEEAIAAVVVT